jgi:LuxR family maltose regulon positive regulatory protein
VVDEVLLTTKTRIPPPRRALVPRRELLARLDEIDAFRLVVVAAPAGFGKTTLLAAWARGGAHRVAWLSLDKGDNDLARFLAYLVAAIQGVAAPLGEGAASLLQRPQPAAPEQVLTALLNDVAATVPADERLVLVLDDYHLITTPQIHEALSFLIEHAPPGLHLILLTRADPPLPLPLLRARGQLLEIRQSDLRFSEEEAIAFLQQTMGVTLRTTEAEILVQRTEGWAAGLQMAALALKTGSGEEQAAAFVAAFTGTHRYVLDYLLEEVLQRQSPAMQLFLLQTSVLERLYAPLCDALVDDGVVGAQQALAYLEAENLFIVPLDEQRSWFRYHQLFADLLQLRLRQQMPDKIPVLHQRASRWHEVAGEMGPAVDHALAAGDVERALALVGAAAESTLMRGEAMTLLHWVESLPATEVRARPYLALYYAWALLLAGRPADDVLLWLEAAEAREGGQDATRPIRAYLALLQGRVLDARDDAERALAELPAQDRFLRQLASLVLGMTAPYDEGSVATHFLEDAVRSGREVDNLVVTVLGVCARGEFALRQGDLLQAQSHFAQALRLAGDGLGDLTPLASEPLIGLAQVAMERNELNAAETYLAQAMGLEPTWNKMALLDALITQARLQRTLGDVEGAHEQLAAAAALARQFDATELDDAIVAVARADMALWEGDLASVAAWLATRGLESDDAPPETVPPPEPDYDAAIRKYEYLALARLQLARGDAAAALVALDRLLPAFERCRARILIHLSRALAYHAVGKEDAALAAVAEALALGQPGGFVRVFVDEVTAAHGEPLARLLYRALAAEISPAYASYLLQQLPEAAERASPAQAPLIEPLSEREMEVLQLVAEGLTNQEIAERLFLSLATIKWHASNIYSKLGVNNRTEAVARGQTLGLL